MRLPKRGLSAPASRERGPALFGAASTRGAAGGAAVRKPAPAAQGAAACLAGFATYALLALIESWSRMGPLASALAEEAAKILVLAGLGLAAVLLAEGRGRSAGAAASSAGTAAPPPGGRLLRTRLLAFGRGLRLGLIAAASFALAENLAYYAAFAEAGVFTRLLWSLPVHLVAALFEALGLYGLARPFLRRAEEPSAAVAAAAADRRPRSGYDAADYLIAAALVAAGPAWHLGANALAASGLLGQQTRFLGLAFLQILVLVLAGASFVRHALIGGFTHGAE